MLQLCLGNHEDFSLLINNGLKLDKYKSIVSTVSIFVFANLQLAVLPKNSCVECFSVSQQKDAQLNS